MITISNKFLLDKKYVSDLAEPVPKGIPIETVDTSKTSLRLAEANGKFYNSFLNAYLDNGFPERRNPQISPLVEALPSHMRNLYSEGIKRYREELDSNHNLLQQRKGEEVSYLLSAVLRSEGKSDEEISEIQQRATPDKARFIEPSAGVAIIETEKDFFRYLQEKGMIHAEGDAVCFASDNRGEPSFMVVRRMSLEKSLVEEGVSAAQKSSVRHEFHHFIWNFLERGKFVRPVEEVSPELATSFKHFRDELSAYIIQGRPLDTIEPDLLAYTEDKEILQRAREVRNYAAICMKLSEQLDVEPQTFLYAAMTSRNFDELRRNFGVITPLEGEINQAEINATYSVWSRNRMLERQFQELLKQKDVILPPQLVSQLNVSRLSSSEHTSVSDLHHEIDRLNEFARAISSNQVDAEALKNTLKNRLQLPDITIDVILNQPREMTRDMPLTNVPEEFLRRYISFWAINNEQTRGAYTQILASSPIMRETFNKIKDEIMVKGADEYRKEMSNPARHQQTEAEIQERTRMIMSL